MKIKGILVTVVSALLFGVTPIIAKMAYASGANAETLVFYRNLFAFPLLFMICYGQKIELRITKKEAIEIVKLGIFGIASTTLMLYLSYHYISIGTATTLHFLYPVFVALLCRFLYKEKLSRSKIITLCFAMIGILFFLDELDGSGAVGMLLSLASGVTYGYYMVGVEKKGLKQMNPFKLSMYFSLVVSIVMFYYNLQFQRMVWIMPVEAYGYMLLVSLGTSFVGVVLLHLGIKHLGATMASIFCMFEPIASVIAGIIFLSESISFSKLIGCAIILMAVTFLVILDNRRVSV